MNTPKVPISKGKTQEQVPEGQLPSMRPLWFNIIGVEWSFYWFQYGNPVKTLLKWVAQLLMDAVVLWRTL